MSNELYHYGVKGMKWGVINDRPLEDKNKNNYPREDTNKWEKTKLKKSKKKIDWVDEVSKWAEDGRAEEAKELLLDKLNNGSLEDYDQAITEINSILETNAKIKDEINNNYSGKAKKSMLAMADHYAKIWETALSEIEEKKRNRFLDHSALTDELVHSRVCRGEEAIFTLFGL